MLALTAKRFVSNISKDKTGTRQFLHVMKAFVMQCFTHFATQMDISLIAKQKVNTLVHKIWPCARLSFFSVALVMIVKK